MIKRIIKLLDHKQKLKSYVLLSLMSVASILEMISLSLIIPILGLFLNSEKIPYIDALNNFGIAHYNMHINSVLSIWTNIRFIVQIVMDTG